MIDKYLALLKHFTRKMSPTKKDGTSFTSVFASVLDFKGTRWLGFRDIPHLIDKYVNGNIVLDYGCGKGISTLFLKSQGLKVDGVDVSKDMIRLAKMTDPGGKYTVIQSGKIPVNDNYYDLAAVLFVLPYISNKTEIRNILREIRRCLKPNGVLITTVASEHLPKHNWFSYDMSEGNEDIHSGCIVTVKPTGSRPTVYLYFWDDSDYKQVISESGLNIIHIHHPFGNNYDGFKWVNEDKIPPYTTYVAKKFSESE